MNKSIYDLLRRNRIWPKRIISHSKSADRDANREFDIEQYIDEVFLISQRKKQRNQCTYCKTSLQTINRKLHNGLTVERMDNALAHLKNNCVLCCSSCNCRRFTVCSLESTKNQKYLKQRMKFAGALRGTFKQILKYNDSRRSCYS